MCANALSSRIKTVPSVAMAQSMLITRSYSVRNAMSLCIRIATVLMSYQKMSGKLGTMSCVSERVYGLWMLVLCIRVYMCARDDALSSSS